MSLPLADRSYHLWAVGVLILLVIISALSLTSVASDDPIGSGAALRSGFGARALGMGGAYVAVANDYSAPYWNPAGITRGNSIYLGGMRYDQYGLGLDLDFLSGGLTFSEGDSESSSFLPTMDFPVIKGASFAGTYLGFSTEVRALGPGGSQIPITYAERAYLATAGLKLPLAGSFGISGKLYSYSAPNAGVDGKDASANGLGFDLGYLAEPLDGFTIGIVGFDLTGTEINWQNTPTEPTNVVATRYSLGSAYTADFSSLPTPDFASGKLLVSGQYSFGPNVLNKIRAGLEYSFSILSLRVGAVKPADSEVYFSAGGGLRVKFLTGNLAWIQNNSLEGENTTDTIVFSAEFLF